MRFIAGRGKITDGLVLRTVEKSRPNKEAALGTAYNAGPAKTNLKPGRVKPRLRYDSRFALRYDRSGQGLSQSLVTRPSPAASLPQVQNWRIGQEMIIRQ